MMTKSKRTKKIKTGDTVIAIAGNSKGQSGKILSITGNRAVVQGLNFRKKHTRKSQAVPQGTIQKFEAPIDLSNLMVCVTEDMPKRLHVRTNSDGQRELYYNDGDKAVTYRPLKKS